MSFKLTVYLFNKLEAIVKQHQSTFNMGQAVSHPFDPKKLSASKSIEIMREWERILDYEYQITFKDDFTSFYISKNKFQ